MSPADHTWWLLSRSAGVVALILVAASTLIGLTLAAGLAGPPQRRKTLVAFHEQTANAAAALLVAGIKARQLKRARKTGNISVTSTEI
jgi:methionine sulfoxide reductase heme-binding subunit